MHIKRMMNKIIEKGKAEDMEWFGDLFVDMVYEMKDNNPQWYKSIEYQMHKMAYGNHLTEDMAKCWVSKMENKDGTKGEHWSIEQTSTLAGEYDKNDFYAVLNMIYSDYYNSKFDTNIYIEIAKDWLNDKDIGECKTLRYYMFVVK